MKWVYRIVYACVQGIRIRHSLLHLKTLEMHSNQFDAIQPFAFQGFPQLEHLSLSGNRITFLKNYTFCGLYHLIELYIRDNQIGNVSALAFHGLHNLHVLYLTNNRILEIDLSDIPKGSVIYLEQNPLNDADNLHGFKKVSLQTHRFQRASGE